ncbi:MAG: hypothetical protein Q7S54_01400 [bacterium]|nr:hypothetical protein [bacterium]
MADDKKKPAPAAPSRTTLEEIIFFLAGLLLLAVILNQIISYLGSFTWYSSEAGWTEILREYFRPFWSVWKVIAVALSAACVVWTIYSLRKLGDINKEEAKIYGSQPEESLLEQLTEEKVVEKKNEKWLRVTEHANSENLSDWKLAIIEADVMLEELLRTLGYHGDSVGEMLKSAEGGDFIYLDAAWEAHKVRNRIAHQGGDFQLNERETRRAIALFETVFREARII